MSDEVSGPEEEGEAEQQAWRDRILRLAGAASDSFDGQKDRTILEVVKPGWRSEEVGWPSR